MDNNNNKKNHNQNHVPPREEDLIREALTEKSWQEIKTLDTWEVFKIMAEFIEGYEKMSEIGPSVTIFGSARTKSNHRYYKLAEELAYNFSKVGYGIITGGGPGIMEAANRGAHFAGGRSVGLNINLPTEQSHNPYIDNDKLINFHHFFVRKAMFMKYSQAFIVMPGGYGTLDELFEAMTLIQTKKIAPFPIVLMVKKYWDSLLEWIKEEMLVEENISPEDLGIFVAVNTVEEAVKHVEDHYKKYRLKPNF
jgi:uncharacterized protein (TIGR00730 family)